MHPYFYGEEREDLLPRPALVIFDLQVLTESGPTYLTLLIQLHIHILMQVASMFD